MSGPAYSTHGVSLFNGISDAGTIIPTSLGAGLIFTGTMFCLLREQAKAALGEKPDFAKVILEALTCAAFLMLHGWIAQNVWSTAQSIATGIYPDTKLAALGKLLVSVASKFQDYSFSLTSIGAGIKDSAVVLVALFAWMLTLLSHWQLEVLQVCIYNVVFAFAPVVIGLSMFGFGGRKLWFSSIVEVSSWSITMAVVYRSIDAALFSYLQEASTLSFTDTKFIDVISMLVFLSSLPLVVPVVTGRLLGSATLGELGRATSLGAGLTDPITSRVRGAMASLGPVSSPTAKSVAGPSTSRPGDK